MSTKLESLGTNKGVFDRVARNLVKMGYFRTDDKTVNAILSHIKPAETKIKVLDPCCGEGIALHDFKKYHGDRCVTYGIELDAKRTADARERVDHVVHASYDNVSSNPGAYGCLFLNPPYGDSVLDQNGKKHRLEIEFLRKTLNYLAVDGLLVYIIPNTSLTDGLIESLSKFSNLRVYRACVDTYKQLVIMGCRPLSRRSFNVDEEAKKALTIAREQPELCPVLEPVAEPCYTIPPTRAIELFKPVFISPYDVSNLLNEHSLGNQLINSLEETARQFSAPLMPVRDGHLGTMVSAGALDGIIPTDDGKELYLKGSCFRIAETTSQGNKEGSGAVKETTIHKTVSQIATLQIDEHEAVLSLIGSDTGVVSNGDVEEKRDAPVEQMS